MPRFPTQHLAPALFGVALLAVYALLCQRITPNVAIPGPLRLDIVVLALCIAAMLLLPSGSLAGPWSRGSLRACLAVGGALLGAAAVAPWAAVPWLVVAALAFLWSGRNRGRYVRRRGFSFAVILLTATVNLVVVSAVMARGFRISPDDFASLDLRANVLLADVPIHDAWAVDLESEGSATMDDAAAAFRRFRPFQSTPVVLVLGVARGVLGHFLGWEDPRWMAPETSFVQRLTDVDHERSALAPGTEWGMWRLLYAFPEEGAVEIINGTVHLAVACAVENRPGGSSLYLVFRVNDVNWSTPFYMRLIDPFRRHLVYPTLLRQFAHTWGLEANDLELVTPDSSTLVPVSGGTYSMGDGFSEGAEDELPLHQVTLADFYLGDAEITVGKFRRFILETGYRTSAEGPVDRAAQDSLLLLAIGADLTREEREALYDEALLFSGCGWWDPDSHRFDFDEFLDWDSPGFEQTDEHPAVCLSWDDAAMYANWLSGLEGLPPAYDVVAGELLDVEGVPTTDVTRVRGYRLPTEAEWEYAAREGGRLVRFGSGKDVADPREVAFDASVGDYPYQNPGPLRRVPSAIRSYPPNALGLYDMAGNAWEWVSDFLAPYPSGPQVNPYQAEGRGRAVRGGRWGGDAFESRTAKRFQWQSNNRCNASGFRLARSR